MVLHAAKQKTFFNMPNRPKTPTMLFNNRSIDLRLPWSSYAAKQKALFN